MNASDLVVEDVPYVAHDGEAFLARVHRSTGTGPGAPAIVDVHPGAWSEGDRLWGQVYDEALARRGFVVVAVDFRQAPRFQHPAASADVATAVRWTRAAAGDLGVDPARISLVGSSSGGHLALLAACRPNAREHAGRPLRWKSDAEVAGETDASVARVAALWAPADPLARTLFARERMRHGTPDERDFWEPLRRGAESYFGDDSTMQAASVPRLVSAGEATDLPPLYVCRPEHDANVPPPIVEALVDAWRSAGGDVTVGFFAGQPHAFGHRPGPMTDRLVDELCEFFEVPVESVR